MVGCINLAAQECYKGHWLLYMWWWAEHHALWWTANIITLPATRNRSPNTSAHCILVLELPRKTQQLNTGWNNTFTHKEKWHIRARSAPIVYMSTPWLSGSPSAVDAGQFAYVHPSPAATEGPQHSPMESEILKARGMAEAHWCICLRRTKEHSLRLKQGKIFSHRR